MTAGREVPGDGGGAGRPAARLVVLLKGYPRLSETFIAQELRGLERAGLRLHIFSMRHPTDTRRHPVHDEIEAPVTYLPEYLHHEPRRVLRALGRVLARREARRGLWRALALAAREFRHDPSRNRLRRLGQGLVLAAEWPADADWLHVHFLHTPASVARHASRMTGTGWTVSAHAKDIWTQSGAEIAAKLGEAQWCVTCTRAGWEHLRALAPRPGDVHLVHHGLDLDRFAHAPRAPSARDGRDPADPVRIASVGRLVPKKGYEVALRALALLPGDLAWRLDHIGGGPESARLAGLARSLRLADRIRWHGPQAQAEVLALCRAADLFVLPSRVAADGDRDGLPNVLVEAASQGLCCIGSAISGIPELIRDDQNGLLVPPDDPQALARAIGRAIRDPALRARLGAAAEQTVRDQFDARAGIARLCGLFAEVRPCG